MTEYMVSELTDCNVAQDGRTAILNFQVLGGSTVSLHFNALELEKTMHELGFIITKARSLSELPKQGIVSMLRPSKARASLFEDKRTVAISFQIRTGLEIHYGFEPTMALALSAQVAEAAQQGMKTPAPRGH